MICIDSSALMAIVLREPEAQRCRQALLDDDELVISTATLAESMIVAGQRHVRSELEALVRRLNLEVHDVTREIAPLVADIYEIWGKGYHPARLNYGDCFAYELASRLKCPLLYVGNDFAQTDIESVL